MKKEEILEKIKESRKYKTLSEEVILQEIERYIKRNPGYERFKDKKILKDIKTELHKAYSRFQSGGSGKREKYLEEIKQSLRVEAINKILSTNRSTKERLPIYLRIYEEIFRITGKPDSIIDLGCGLNPFSFPFMGLNRVEYHAYDIDQSDISLINEFFEIMKSRIRGKAELLDLSNMLNILKAPNSDICLMFKLLDVLEKRKGHKYAEDIIKVLIKKCKYVVVSFSKLTITGNPMNFPQRGWIERMLERLNIPYKKLDFENEVVYVIKESYGEKIQKKSL